ncbi:MAG: hypothetical protein CMB53_00630 [Euryarchaeota archaeon]|nr:hypothetical protein [Euryarchaeota archaeon]
MVDVIISLVDRESLSNLLSLPLGEVISGMEDMSIRGTRPRQAGSLHRQFDIDLEGEVLEWADRVGQIDQKSSLSKQSIDLEDKLELLLLLSHWSSMGEWRCWDARLFLYVEPATGNRMSGTGSFLNPDVWRSFSETISNTDRTSFIESVVIDWMSRREELGETMDPSMDPRILPTMESHQNSSGSLFDIIDKSRREGHPLMIGREYLDPFSWYIGNQKLVEFIEA